MKITTKPIEDHQIEMVVEIEKDKFEAAKVKAAQKISKKVKVPGFRPGKAPFQVIRNIYGDAAITEEAIEILVEEIYPDAVKEANLEPGAPGQLANIESIDPPTFKFIVPLKATIELGDYKSIRKAYTYASPDESKLQTEIENIRRMYAKTETVERPVEDGDYILIDIAGYDAKDKEKAEAILERKGYALVVRKEGVDTEFPYKGFSAKLIGAAPASVVKVTNTFEKDHADEKLAGKKVNIEATIKTIRAVIMPELDDDFAKMTGLGSNVAEFTQRFKDSIDAEEKAKFDDDYFEGLLDEIKTVSTIKYPPQVIEHEIEHVLEDVERRLQAQGIENMDAYYKMLKTTPEAFIEEQAKPTSIKRLERGMIMDELARLEEIRLENDQLEEEFRTLWTNLAMTDPEFAKRTKNGTKPSQDIINAVTMDAANRLLTRLTLDRLKAIATGEQVDAPASDKPKAKAKSKAKVATEAAAEAPTEAAAEKKPRKTKKAEA